MDAVTSDLVVRLAKMGGRLRSCATAAQGLGLTGGFVAFVAGIVIASRTGSAAIGPTHPQVALGFAVALGGVLYGASMWLLSHVIEVIADYVSAAHLVGVSES